MIQRVLGGTGMSVSALGFGGAEIGFEKADIAAVEKLLGAALDAGLNVIDTAECYRGFQEGKEVASSEDLIGRAVSGRRSDFYLFTKVGHSAGLPGEDWDPAMMAESIDRSLKNLRTDCVDLIQLHSCSEDKLRQGDVIDVLRRARDAGKTRFIGYSGDREDALYAIECGAFDTLQTSVNIADQECLTLTLPKARERGMGVIAKRPIANAAWKSGPTEPPANPYCHPYWKRLRELAYDFLTTPEDIQTALRFTLSAPGVHTAIVGTAKPERWAQNAALVGDGTLPPAVWESIRTRWLEVATPDWTGQR